MAEHKALATEDQHGRVRQAGDAAVRKERRARQKVAVAVHEVHGQALRRSLQGRAALGFDAAGFVQGIVAHPHLEQVAQDEKGVGRGALQVVLPGANGGGLTGLQVQVGNEIDRAPVRRSGKLLEPGHGRGHGDRFQIRGPVPSRSRRLPWVRRHESRCGRS